MARSGPGPSAEQRKAQIPVLWPRYVPDGRGGRIVRAVPIDPARIPAGWQSIQIHVPMRLATCEETGCPLFLNGWTEVITASGNVHPQEGALTPDEAAQLYGYFGAASTPPTTIHHPAGMPCPEIHKVPSGVPPLYTVNGRPVLWNEFEDRLGGGIHQTQQLIREGVA